MALRLLSEDSKGGVLSLDSMIPCGVDPSGNPVYRTARDILRLIKLNLLPLMYIYDQCDILFFIKSIQNSSDHFNIQTFIKFCHHSTRSSSSNKLEHVFTSSN